MSAAEAKPEQPPKAEEPKNDVQKGDKSKDKPKKEKKMNYKDPKSVPAPEFWERRIARFEELYAAQQKKYEEQAEEITVTMLDGNTRKSKSWVTTPIDIAKQISNSLPDKVFVAKVNDQLWDLIRPLEGDCTLEFLDWEAEESQEMFWHSSAHILGAGMEWRYGAKLSSGPPLEEGGFFYEAETTDPVSEADYQAVEALVKDVIAKKHPFQRLVLSKEDALDLFKYNKFKHATLSDKVPEGVSCTAYRCGPLIDPCRGPHIPHTGRAKAFMITKNSSSYWRGVETNPVLQRIYGIAFPKADMLKEWKEVMAAAAENDHRKIGVRQNLWMFHDFSPGSAFWHQHGTHIYNTLTQWMRRNYRKNGFTEVISPNMYNSELWKTSGHWQKYADDMFQLKETDKGVTYALKPMNCPGHCVMFACTRRSHKEFPIRMADFGVLHRNERAGALSGLTRVRRFCQDDAHIFCLPEQTEAEIESGLQFLEDVYRVLGFKFHLALSTRPVTMLGTHEMWDRSEGYLRNALNKFCNIPMGLPDPFTPGKTFDFDGCPNHVRRLKKHMEKATKEEVAHGIKHIWAVNEGDGAFYGPKIDIRIEDCMKSMHAHVFAQQHPPQHTHHTREAPARNAAARLQPAAEVRPDVRAVPAAPGGEARGGHACAEDGHAVRAV